MCRSIRPCLYYSRVLMMASRKPPISAIEIKHMSLTKTMRPEKIAKLTMSTCAVTQDFIKDEQIKTETFSIDDRMEQDANCKDNVLEQKARNTFGHDNSIEQLIRKWKYKSKEKYVLPKLLLDKVTTLIQMVYIHNETLMINNNMHESQENSALDNFDIKTNCKTPIQDSKGNSRNINKAPKHLTTTRQIDQGRETRIVPTGIENSKPLSTSSDFKIFSNKDSKVSECQIKEEHAKHNRKNKYNKIDDGKLSKDGCVGQNKSIPTKQSCGNTLKMDTLQPHVSVKRTNEAAINRNNKQTKVQINQKTESPIKVKSCNSKNISTQKVLKSDEKIKNQPKRANPKEFQTKQHSNLDGSLITGSSSDISLDISTTKDCAMSKTSIEIVEKQFLSEESVMSDFIESQVEVSAPLENSIDYAESLLISETSEIIKLETEENSISNISPDILLEPPTEEELGQYDLSELFTGVLDNKYEKWKKRERKSKKKKGDNNKLKDDKGEQRRPPNYFVAIQITNKQITKGIADVQCCMCTANENLRPAMISLPTLHLTLRVAHLKDDDDISKMIKALDECVNKFSDGKEEQVLLNVCEVGDFRKEVVFAKVEKDDNHDKIVKLVESLEESCQLNSVPPSDGKGFTPHITIAKLSKVPFKLKKKASKKIEASSYAEFKSHNFGKQLVTGLQLCSMNKPKDKAGYYHISHSTQLRYRSFSTLSKETYTTEDVAHMIVASVLAKAIESLKEETLK